MLIEKYPDTRIDTEKELKELLSKLDIEGYPDVYALCESTLKDVMKSGNLDALFAPGIVRKLKNNKTYKIFEFRIPPKRRGGVLRIYFCYKSEDNSKIIILGSEFKKEVSSNSEKIKQAKKRYNDINK